MAVPSSHSKFNDGFPRFTFDGRGINLITVFDTEPLPNMATLLDDLHSAAYLSSIDLSKGYGRFLLDNQTDTFYPLSVTLISLLIASLNCLLV